MNLSGRRIRAEIVEPVVLRETIHPVLLRNLAAGEVLARPRRHRQQFLPGGAPLGRVVGAVAIGAMPASDRPEIAFAGRSNVGKSSLINMLTGRKALAKVSKEPGASAVGGGSEDGGGSRRCV